ncbi:hypothetical protein Tco_0344683 [Tanacetum coccineum]
MSDSDESGVTHIEIPSPFKGLSDIGSPGVVGPEHEGLPWMLDDPYVQEDEVFSAEEQPLPATASPTTQSPDYVLESDPEEDPKENDDEDPEEDPVDYPADGGDDGDDKDEPSDDDEDEEVDIEADDEEEEEHPAPADSTAVALPAADQAPSAEETEQFETDESAATPPPHPAYRVTARISIPAPVPTPVCSDVELRAEAASTSHSLPLPLPIILSHTRPDAPSSGTPPLHLLSTDRREERPEVTLSPRKRLGIALGPRYEIRESSSVAAAKSARGLRADYVEAMQGTPVVTDVVELSQRMTEFETRVRRDTNEVYTRLDDEQSGRQLFAGWLKMLFRDRRAHAQVMSLRTTVLAQQSQIRELQSADRRRQTVITEMLAADHRRQKQLTEALKLIKRLQTQMAEFERQQGPAKGPAQPELPEEAGSSS